MSSPESNNAENICIKINNEDIWGEIQEKSITEPLLYVLNLPGKDMRGRLIDAFNHWLNVPPGALEMISNIVTVLHNASLLIDDIEDNSQLRRGQPVAHKIFGVAQTINCANYIYFLAVRDATTLRNFQNKDSTYDVVDVVLLELINLHRGQGLDIVWRDSLTCPAETDYIDMVNKKTGGLLRIAVKLMMACATTNLGIDYIPLVNQFGVFFQIRDDLMNLNSNEYEKNKGFAEDLTEGKFSFPVIHGIHAQPESRLLTNVLQKRPTTPSVKLHAIAHLRQQTHSFQYSESVLAAFETEIRNEIAVLGGNDILTSLIDRLGVTTLQAV
ncbi:farnesyltranstransferase [Dendrothele bispora CBS 962.96]|uniref:(2E,6E)-farnesyl diphosphate synthase n=1 Tax=Dendrothele bispora (strain CBS 962.96) TaxID=1314807 RepID=A0A4S8MWM4_DENBC|nr:farnesyltranstransferase [Dendrothele bispora CBS 962.96]